MITALDGQPVRSVEQVRPSMKGRPKQVALRILRDGQPILVPVDLG